MDRRKALKTLAVGAAAPTLLESCKTKEANKKVPGPEATADRMQEELVHDKALLEGAFFTPHELATVAVLTDIIIPKDEVSGSATDAGVPAFIDFMAKDRPELQTPLRGGLRWLDMVCSKQYQKAFKDCSPEQRIALVTAIAYPKKVQPGFEQGAGFFSLLRNLTITGFYTSEMGFKDLGYMGNVPNQWNGVPAEVLRQYSLAYSEKELQECVQYNISL